jgi:hypothetical protein
MKEMDKFILYNLYFDERKLKNGISSDSVEMECKTDWNKKIISIRVPGI